MKTIITILLIGLGITGLFLLSKETNSETPSQPRSMDVINLIDPSGTTLGKGWPMPPKDFYQREIELIENSGGGNLIIFNMSQPIPIPISLHLEAIVSEPDVYSGGEQDVQKVRAVNKRTKQQNDIHKAEFLRDLDSCIIKFVPTKGHDYTFVNSTIREVIKTVNLLNKSSPAAPYIFIYSDLLDHTPQSSPAPLSDLLIKQVNSLSAQISLCSYTENSATENLKNTPVSSTSDFISLLTSNK